MTVAFLNPAAIKREGLTFWQTVINWKKLIGYWFHTAAFATVVTGIVVLVTSQQPTSQEQFYLPVRSLWLRVNKWDKQPVSSKKNNTSAHTSSFRKSDIFHLLWNVIGRPWEEDFTRQCLETHGYLKQIEKHKVAHE